MINSESVLSHSYEIQDGGQVADEGRHVVRCIRTKGCVRFKEDTLFDCANEFFRGSIAPCYVGFLRESIKFDVNLTENEIRYEILDIEKRFLPDVDPRVQVA